MKKSSVDTSVLTVAQQRTADVVEATCHCWAFWRKCICYGANTQPEIDEYIRKQCANNFDTPEAIKNRAEIEGIINLENLCECSPQTLNAAGPCGSCFVQGHAKWMKQKTEVKND